ncbi:MAG TPA: YdcF family protein [Dokdonella sp.]
MLSPLRLLAIVLLVGLVVRRRAPAWLRRGLIAAVALLVVLTMPVGANALVWLQEARAPAAADCTGEPAAIVLLSGGVREPPRDGRDYAALGDATLLRLFAAADLYRRRPLPVAIIGTSGHAVADSRVVAALARALGVAGADLREEAVSLTTWENAQAAAAMRPPLPRQIWLVTSPLHLARAAYSFETAGFSVCAWPSRSDFRSVDGAGYFLPSASAVLKSQAVLHEWVGEAFYRVRHALARA